MVLAAGVERNVPELITRAVTVSDTVHAHTLAMVAVGLTGADAYYRGPYPGGAAVLLIKDPAYPRPAVEFPLVHAALVIPQSISAVPLDHRRAVSAYFAHLGATVQTTDATVTARDALGHTLTARFDDLGRLANLKGSAGPK